MNFGKRDLGLVLSETVGDADTLRFTKDARYVAINIALLITHDKTVNTINSLIL